MPVTFCKPCLAILKQMRSKPEKGSGQHHRTFTELSDAANDGCQICKRLRRRFLGSGEIDPAVLRKKGDRYFYQDSRSPTSESASTLIPHRGKDVIYFETDKGHRPSLVPLELVAVPVVEDGLQDMICPPTVNTGSEGSLTLATQWLQICITHHTTCNRPRPAEQKDWKPSRLLYVGDEKAQELRLCPATAMPSQVTYTTLSHCWGPDPKRLNLTTENIATWIKGIPEKGMTQTFKDAIKVTRRLKVQYLWIDSLCIIQDSKTDWLHESSLMSNVYKYSFCNIAATASADDHGGCFRDRDPLFDLPTRVNLAYLEGDSPEERPGSDHIEERGPNHMGGLYDLYWNDQWIRDVNDSPLFKRAWVLQERILSPRMVHFAKTQLYWECNEFAACEAYPNGMSTENNMLQKQFRTTNPFNCVPGISKESEDDDVPKDLDSPSLGERNYNLWAQTVQDYSRTNLTKEEDKLIAMSGIAREMQVLMQSRYLAGHWASDLIRQLAWFQPLAGKPSIYCAPSWSWASTKAGPSALRFHSYDHLDDFHPLAEVVEMYVELEGDDAFGPVKAGYLDILGQLFPIEVTDKSDRPLAERKILEVGVKGYAMSLNYHRDIAAILEGPLYCMPLALELPISGKRAPFSGGVGFNSLVLQQCDDSPNVYRRVGYASPRSYDGLFDAKDRFFGLLGKIGWRGDGKPTFSRNMTGVNLIRLV